MDDQFVQLNDARFKVVRRVVSSVLFCKSTVLRGKMTIATWQCEQMDDTGFVQVASDASRAQPWITTGCD
jgi:hypothetical protein